MNVRPTTRSAPPPPTTTATARGVAVLRLTGELDIATRTAHEQRINDLLDGHLSALVLDMTHVELLASAGIRLLVDAQHRATTSGTALAVVSSHRRVLRPLQVTGVDAVLSLYPTEAAALRAAG